MTLISLDQSLFTIEITKPNGQQVTFEIGQIWWDSNTTLKISIINADLTGNSQETVDIQFEKGKFYSTDNAELETENVEGYLNTA